METTTIICKGSDLTGIKIEHLGEKPFYILSILNQPKLGSLLRLTVYHEAIYQAVLGVITSPRSSLFTLTFYVSNIKDCIGVYYAQAFSEFDLGLYVEPKPIDPEDLIRFRVSPIGYQAEYDLSCTAMPLEDELNLLEDVSTLNDDERLIRDSRGQSIGSLFVYDPNNDVYLSCLFPLQWSSNQDDAVPFLTEALIDATMADMNLLHIPYQVRKKSY